MSNAKFDVTAIGNAIARSVIEVSRSIRYRDLTQASLEAALATRPTLADSQPGTPGYTIRSRNIDYRLTLSVCSLDDPKDDYGVRPECPLKDKPKEEVSILPFL